jgi:hypothetical protein
VAGGPQSVVGDIVRHPREVNQDDVIAERVDVLVEELFETTVALAGIVDVPEFGV